MTLLNYPFVDQETGSKEAHASQFQDPLQTFLRHADSESRAERHLLQEHEAEHRKDERRRGWLYEALGHTTWIFHLLLSCHWLVTEMSCL